MATVTRRLMSLRYVAIYEIITLIIVIHCSVNGSLSVNNARVLKVITPLTKNFSVPKILRGNKSQIILMGHNLYDGMEVTLTKEPKGKYCNSSNMVTIPLKASSSNQHLKSVHFYLTSKITKHLSDLKNVWICLIQSDFSSLSENFVIPIWVHQGDTSKIEILNPLGYQSNEFVHAGTSLPPWRIPSRRTRKNLHAARGERRARSATHGSSRTPPREAGFGHKKNKIEAQLHKFLNGGSSGHRSDTRPRTVVSDRTSGINSSRVGVSNSGLRTSGGGESPPHWGVGLSVTGSTNHFFNEDSGNVTDISVVSSQESAAFHARDVDTPGGVPRSRGTRNIEDSKLGSLDNTLLSTSTTGDLTAELPVDTVPQVTGLRVESLDKGISYDGDNILLQADYEAMIRLFGVGLTKEVSIQFTAHNSSFGASCDSSTSEVFQLDVAEGHWAVLGVRLPQMATSQQFWFVCVRERPHAPAVHQGAAKWLTISTYSPMLPIWIQIIFLIILLLLSGLFSGLNLGLMALDKTELKIVMNTGTLKERAYAKAIEPVRRHGNFLLCTLLLGNVLVNSTLTILLDTLSSGLIAVIGSTIGIVIFGEIVPQAICSRHGLAVGARTAWLVRIFMGITGVVAWPISKVLDLLLGEEIGNTYDRERLKELIKVTQDRNDLRLEEQNIICGALELSRKTVSEVMTKLDDMFMLSIERSLDFNTINEIMEQGYSRIPIYDGERTNIMSVLLIKDLAFIDPDDNTPLRTLSQYYQNVCNFVFEDTTLDVIFKEFKEGNKGHMAFVQRVNNDGDYDPFYEVIGLVTLEDVIEELIQAEIVDETDVFTDNKSKRRRKHIRRNFKEFSQHNQSNHKKVQISPQMQVAAFQYLRTSVEPFKEGNLSEGILKRMLNQDIIHIIKEDSAHNQSRNYIFAQGKPVDFFILILEGHVEVTIGKENMTFESGPFTYFGLMTLSISAVGESPSASTHMSRNSIVGSVQSLDSTKFCFTPDYSVRATTEVTFLKVKRSHYVAARRAYLLEQSQKDSLAEETFEREMEKMLRDESLTSPVWESETDNEPTPKDALLNGGTVHAKLSDQEDLITVADEKRNAHREALIPLKPLNSTNNLSDSRVPPVASSMAYSFP